MGWRCSMLSIETTWHFGVKRRPMTLLRSTLSGGRMFFKADVVLT